MNYEALARRIEGLGNHPTRRELDRLIRELDNLPDDFYGGQFDELEFHVNVLLVEQGFMKPDAEFSLNQFDLSYHVREVLENPAGPINTAYARGILTPLAWDCDQCPDAPYIYLAGEVCPVHGVSQIDSPDAHIGEIVQQFNTNPQGWEAEVIRLISGSAI